MGPLRLSDNLPCVKRSTVHTSNIKYISAECELNIEATRKEVKLELVSYQLLKFVVFRYTVVCCPTIFCNLLAQIGVEIHTNAYDGRVYSHICAAFDKPIQRFSRG